MMAHFDCPECPDQHARIAALEAQVAALACERDALRAHCDRLAAALRGLPEFGNITRCGRACCACGGLEHGSYGYAERGPDRGHEHGCVFRTALDALAKLEER